LREVPSGSSERSEEETTTTFEELKLFGVTVIVSPVPGQELRRTVNVA